MLQMAIRSVSTNQVLVASRRSRDKEAAEHDVLDVDDAQLDCLGLNLDESMDQVFAPEVVISGASEAIFDDGASTVECERVTQDTFAQT